MLHIQKGRPCIHLKPPFQTRAYNGLFARILLKCPSCPCKNFIKRNETTVAVKLCREFSNEKGGKFYILAISLLVSNCGNAFLENSPGEKKEINSSYTKYQTNPTFGILVMMTVVMRKFWF